MSFKVAISAIFGLVPKMAEVVSINVDTLGNASLALNAESTSLVIDAFASNDQQLHAAGMDQASFAGRKAAYLAAMRG